MATVKPGGRVKNSGSKCDVRHHVASGLDVVQFNIAHCLNGRNVFDELSKEVPWLDRTKLSFKMYGKKYPLRRDYAWLSNDAAACYKFSGTNHRPQPVPDPVAAVMTAVNEAIANLKHPKIKPVAWNAALVNMYGRDDHLGQHRDDESDLINKEIVSISFGMTRDMLFTRKGHKSLRVTLKHGDVLIMLGDTNKLWKHGIPPLTRRQRGQGTLYTLGAAKRISITPRVVRLSLSSLAAEGEGGGEAAE